MTVANIPTHQCQHLVEAIQRGGRPTFQSCMVHRLDMCVVCYEYHMLSHNWPIEDNQPCRLNAKNWMGSPWGSKDLNTGYCEMHAKEMNRRGWHCLQRSSDSALLPPFGPCSWGKPPKRLPEDSASETGNLRARLVLAEEELARLQAKYDFIKSAYDRQQTAIRRLHSDLDRVRTFSDKLYQVFNPKQC